MRLPFRTPRFLLPGLALAALTCAFASVPAAATQDAKTKAEQAEARQKLDEVRTRIESLTREARDTADKRDSANAALARQADQLSAAARALRQSDDELAAKQRDLEQLNIQRAGLQKGLDAQRGALDDLLRATYTLGRGSDLQLLLGDEDLARVSRALAYSRYFQEDRVTRIKGLIADLSRLQDVETAITTEQQSLQVTRNEREQRARALEGERGQQQKLLADADARYKDQAQRIEALKQDEQAMNSLVTRLQKVIDEAPKASAPSVPVGAPAGSPTANLRGDLPWPAEGAVHSYGAGVSIVAARGSEVHSVARGRVVFANFLRGYGMMLILNHGNGWMSLYGNNETLLHGVGDMIEAGEAVGTASAPAGGSGGVYFELRQNGKPVDPRTWLGKRK
jgi:septal ring factor EnvC (AmiA/AmiB activator)